MSFIQLIPFDASKGGNTPDLCLANVCKGYNIGNKYGSAWEAWEHTQQHPSRNVPAGLAVPIFYSYTTTLNGVMANYGHINVQLPNGTIWSDGNIYANIDDYMSKKLPRFVGWGESVNDFKVIEEEISMGVTIQGAPASVSVSDKRIDVFARGTDNNLYQKYWNGSWQPWVQIGTSIFSDPTVSSWGPDRYDVFAAGIKGDLQHWYWPDASGGWSTFESLGAPS